ncbi:hypothetical protein K435DRAFT_971307 [Dendrothele bispora CBS 962.96]|uniref:Uncharacterized protein n=1 Tax=Dendrothele bispora (strain CBS 962.96) TaxID=1314807 RepID=A0A4S8L6B2_DENBC|nr:hypothetical protein K435DRAFT_971307 [Dendrothele bispora CBS 962.96]
MLTMPRHASSRMRNNHVIAPFFPFDHDHLPMPRETTRSRSVGNAARGGVQGALGGASRGHGYLTFTQILPPPTLDGFILETCNRNRI